MYLFLLPVLHFVFTGALPVGSWDNPPVNWLDENGLCRQTASLAAECRHCICVKGQAPACTPIECPQTLESEENKCKPGSQWKEECNKCFCDENGISHCTVKDCQGLEHHLTSKELWHKQEGKLDENGKCIATGSWALDCNICSCSKSGELYCTYYRCTHRHKRASELRRLVRGVCVQGLHFAVDECNTCACVDGSSLDCTQNICSPLSDREKRSPDGSHLSGILDSKGICKKTVSFRDDCNTCACQKGKVAVCTLMACLNHTGKVERITRDTSKQEGSSDITDSKGICKESVTFRDDCNTCTCHKGQLPICTLMACQNYTGKVERITRDASKQEGLSQFLDSNGTCKETVTFSYDCNTCFCQKGFAAGCTLKGCSSYLGKVERITRDTSKQDGLSQFLDSNGTCKETGTFSYDCNTCFCQKGFVAGCTRKGCSSYLGKVERTTRDTSKQDGISLFVDSNGLCKETVTFKYDCNTCVCHKGRIAVCTLIGCPSYPGKVERITRDTSKQDGISLFVDNKGLCKETVTFKYDCNTCVCHKGQIAGCTLMGCPSYPGKVERITRDISKQDGLALYLHSNGTCKETVTFKYDCNTCFCTKGLVGGCTLMGCPSYPGKVERITRDTSKEDGLSLFLDNNGICKETVTFKYDCNTCVCHKGQTGACTLMGCQNYTGKVERITRDTSKQDAPSYSEFVGEDGRCIKQGQFISGCNNCFCEQKGHIYFCTSEECPNQKHKLLRITRDARNENGNSGLECKPGASWKENCNSCFCSERGIAMCTDIPECPSPSVPKSLSTVSGGRKIIGISRNLALNNSAAASEHTKLVSGGTTVTEVPYNGSTSTLEPISEVSEHMSKVGVNMEPTFNSTTQASQVRTNGSEGQTIGVSSDLVLNKSVPDSELTTPVSHSLPQPSSLPDPVPPGSSTSTTISTPNLPTPIESSTTKI